MKLLPLLASAALLFAPLPAVAQGKPGADASPAEMDEEAGAEELLATLRTAVSEMRREMFAPGPAVEGWNRDGADPDAELRAAGTSGHYLLLSAASGTSVVMLTDRRIADLAPAAWRVADSYGSATEAVANPFIQFTALTPRYVIAARANSRRVDTVDCSDPPTHAILYEVPDAPESPSDAEMPLFFRIALLASEEQVVCTRYVREGAAYRPFAFLPDGRSLPQLDEADERVTVVPAAPLETLLRAAAPAQAST